MLDHITIYVENLEKSKIFYEKVLSVLNYKLNISNKENSFYGFWIWKDPYFEIVQWNKNTPIHTGIHIAFKADNKEQIDEFYKTALENWAKDNWKPWPRKDYNPTYYACFFYDLDGNNIEACLY